MNPRSPWLLLKQTFEEWSADKVTQMGAALAYYAVFSLAPLLVIAIAIAGFVFGEHAARGEVVGQLEHAIGGPAARALQEMLTRIQTEGSSLVASMMALGLLLFGASGVFVQLQDALNTIWKVRRKPGSGIAYFIRDRLWSFLIVVSTGFLFLLSLIVNTVLSAVGRLVTPDALQESAYFYKMLNNIGAFVFVVLLLALIYRVLPDAYIRWRFVWLGAVVGALLFTAGNILIGLYVEHGGATSVFGAAGSLAAVLLWIYYSSQILLFGAELTQVYAKQRSATIIPRARAVLVKN